VAALVTKIEETWSQYNSSIFHRIYERWIIKVLQLVIADNSDNNLVHSQRGKLFLAADSDDSSFN
jgi:hypothetical protein